MTSATSYDLCISMVGTTYLQRIFTYFIALLREHLYQMLRNTKIVMHDGYLGPYHDTTNPKMVQVGEEQVLFFSIDIDDEDGPFYLPPEKRRASRYSTEVLLPPEKENFDKLVSKCISRELLTNDRVRKFSRRARSNMLTYKSLDYIHEDGDEEGKMTSNTITHTKIESMKKILKSHRAALDFDKAFVVTSIKTLDVAFDWQKELGECETMTNKKRKRIK
jgi:hypothetical protein